MSIFRNLFKWQKGRQKTGYEKMLLAGATWPIKFDLYLLKFPEGCVVPPHTDDVKNGKHYRLNIVLKQAKSGGEFICTSPIYCSKRIKFFRPDICEHSVTKVISGNRYLLSVGWVRGT
ncbi:2OG-Fe(II) oxygenase [Bowmanella sp. Y26]|uniref:2OG-Fe(II) oxygenase n=1 Tax=Bowmanella yangjiangensis TaxID=2811230 RepID=UPI001BDC6CF2|nr:2OG-Fe(II) oxygenase [Bowmanella yangjiangensis]MBT1063505.1 2OG-Fe(II) oxygenase [Bowmanella yangjiangensis]